MSLLMGGWRAWKISLHGLWSIVFGRLYERGLWRLWDGYWPGTRCSSISCLVLLMNVFDTMPFSFVIDWCFLSLCLCVEVNHMTLVATLLPLGNGLYHLRSVLVSLSSITTKQKCRGPHQPWRLSPTLKASMKLLQGKLSFAA